MGGATRYPSSIRDRVEMGIASLHPPCGNNDLFKAQGDGAIDVAVDVLGLLVHLVLDVEVIGDLRRAVKGLETLGLGEERLGFVEAENPGAFEERLVFLRGKTDPRR